MAMSGFLMAVSCWRHRLQCIVTMLSFLRLLKLHKLAIGKLDLSRWGSYLVSQCVRPSIKLMPEYPFKYTSGKLTVVLVVFLIFPSVHAF